MNADRQLATFGITAGAHNGQVIVTMPAELLTFSVDEWSRWLFWAARALYDAKRQQEEAAP